MRNWGWAPDDSAFRQELEEDPPKQANPSEENDPAGVAVGE